MLRSAKSPLGDLGVKKKGSHEESLSDPLQNTCGREPKRVADTRSGLDEF